MSSPKKEQPTVRRWNRLTRDGTLLTVGIVLTINEAVIRSGEPRPYLLTLFAGMMGMPIVFRSDEKKKDEAASSSPTPPPEPPKPDPIPPQPGLIYKPGVGWVIEQEK